MTSSSEPATGAPHFSLQSPRLQEEFLKERRKRLESHSDTSVTSSPLSPSSSLTSPMSSSSPWDSLSDSPSSPLKSPADSSCGLSLSSPELLSELKKSRTRPLRHVPAKDGLKTVFSGRGRTVPGSSPSSP